MHDEFHFIAENEVCTWFKLIPNSKGSFKHKTYDGSKFVINYNFHSTLEIKIKCNILFPILHEVVEFYLENKYKPLKTPKYETTINTENTKFKASIVSFSDNKTKYFGIHLGERDESRDFCNLLFLRDDDNLIL